MKIKFQNLLFVAFTFAASALSFGQKSNVTSAVLEYKKYSLFNDLETNKKALTNAKKFIDLAAEHAETKEDEKMLFYKGAIYYSFIEMSAMDQKNPVDEKTMESYFNTAKESLTKAYTSPKGKFKEDAFNFVQEKFGIVFNMGVQMSDAKTYDQAAQLFLAAYEIKQLIGDESKETKDAKDYSIICLKQFVNKHLDAKTYDEAVAFVKPFIEAYPKDAEPLTTMANIYLNKDDNAEAEKYLNQAITLAPNNKELFYVIGSIYMDLKQNEKAESNLKRALELDPNYTEAQYQLGAHLYNWAGDLKLEANALKLGDAREPELKALATQKMNEAIVLLEKYIEKNPNEKAVLQILYETHYKLGNKEKAATYKARIDAIK